MKKVWSTLIFMSIVVSTSAGPIAHANGRVSTTQDGNGQLTIDCNWMFWKDCWTFYSEGYMELGDGRILGGAKIISTENCEGDECEFASRTIVTFETIE
jgi:hypothetical protein